MDEQVFVRLENGEIIPIRNSDIQGSSFIIQQPVHSGPEHDDAGPVVTEEVDYETGSTEKVVYIVNQEGSNLDGMQFTVFGDDSTDGQTLTLQTIVSGDNSMNYTNVSDTLPASDIPQSSLPSVQDMSAIEAVSRIVVSEQTDTQTIVAGDIDQTYNNTGAAGTTTAALTDQIDQSGLENVNFTFYCQECGAASDNLDSLKQHLLNEHGILELEQESSSTNDAVALLPSCSTCSKTFLDDNELNKHLKSTPCGDSNVIIAGADDGSSQVVSLPTVEHKCRYCSDKFSTRDNLRDHIASSHPGKSLLESSNTNMFTKCPYCHKMYVHRGVNKALINHIILAHPGKYPLDNSKTDDKVSCKFCGVDFYWKKSLIRHMKQSHPDEFTAEGEEIFAELGVQEVLYPGRRVRRSTKSVNDDDIVVMKCPSCPKTFLWEKSLKRHMMDAHNEEFNEAKGRKEKGSVVYKCPYCSQVSKYACAVRTHVSRKHKSLVKNIDVNKMKVQKIQAAGVEVKCVDTRPVEVRLNLCPVIYRCPFCSYASKQASNLSRHLTSKIHGHIFTNDELKAIGLYSFKVKKRQSNHDHEPEKVDGTSVSALPKLKMKKNVLDIVMKKYGILKQRSLADKENTIKGEEQDDYNELDIENVIAVAEEESEESFDEDDNLDEDIQEADNGMDGVVDTHDYDNDDQNEDQIDDINGVPKNSETVESTYNESNNSELIEGGHAKLTDKANETLAKKNQSCRDNIPMSSVKCIVCQRVFENFTQFKKHLYSHVNLKVTFDCVECQQKFLCSKDILKHLNKRHDILSTELEAKYICMSKMADNRKPLMTYDCPYCDVLFSQSDPLYKHVVDDHIDCIDAAGIKHERESVVRKTKQVVVTAYRCQFCECSFHNITDIVKHMGIIHGEVEKISKTNSGVRKSGRKRKIPKWLEDEIELTPTSKRLKDDEELDHDAEDWNEKSPNISPRKKTRPKNNKMNINKSANISAKKDVLIQTSENDFKTSNDTNIILKEVPEVAEVYKTSNDKDVILKEVPAVAEVTEKPGGAKCDDHSKPIKRKSTKRKANVEGSDIWQSNEVCSTVMLNKCPHCDFTAKRASALTFHINFNHAGIEIKEEPQDSADDPGEIESNGKDVKSHQSKEVKKNENVANIDKTESQALSGTQENITDALDGLVNEEDLLDEDIDFGDSDDDFMPFESNKGGSENFGFSASVKLGCPYCENVFFSTLLLVKDHVQEKHPECSDKFSLTEVKTKVELDNDSELSNVLNTCYHCKKKFRGNLELRTHIKAEHSDGVDVRFTVLDKKRKPLATSDNQFEATLQTDDKYSYRCSFCSKQFGVAENAVKHVHDLHSDKKQVTILVELSDDVTEGFKCPYCVMKSKYKRCIVRHVSRAHKDVKHFSRRDIIIIGSKNTGNATYFQCSFCGFESKYKSSVDQHMDEMHPDENATVNVSMTLWNSLDYLIDHDDGVDYYKCHFCDTVFETQCDVVAHMSADHKSADFKDTGDEKVTNRECLDDGLVYVCPVCNQGSKWLIAVVRHMKISHQELKELRVEKCKVEETDENMGLVFKCEVCNASFNSRRGIVQHSVSMHGKEEKYKVESQLAANSDVQIFCCPYCEYRANVKSSIIKHVAASHPDMKKFKTRDIIHVIENGKNVGDVGGYKCPYCNVVNHWRKSIIRHIRTMHYGMAYDVDIQYQPNATLPEYGQSARKSSKLIECLLCGTLRRSVKTMKQHFQGKHRKYTKDFLNKEYTNFKYAKAKLIGGNPMSGDLAPLTNGGRTLDHGCVLCGAKYVWKKSLLVHIKNYHKDMYEVYRSMDQMVDIVCNAADTVAKQKPVHAVESQSMLEGLEFKPTSAKKKIKRCRKCQKVLATRWAAQGHRKLQHQAKRSGRFSCNDCSLSFSTGFRLQIHKITQHKYKKSGSWHCTGCNYKCKFWSLVQSHFMREHAPKHIFSIDRGVNKCEICSKVFASSRFLKQHLTRHKNTRKPSFQCFVCRQQFTSMSARDTHVEYQHPDMTEMCDICGDMFTRRNLKVHMKTHTEPHLLLTCPFCQKSVFEKTFNRHVLNYHSDLEVCDCTICTSDVNTNPEGSYKCKICLKNTCHNMTLYVHTKFNHANTSSSSKVFQCEMCPDKIFSSKHLRDAHCHKHHRKDVKQGPVSHSSTLNEDPTTHVIHIGQDEGKQFLPKLSETSMNAVVKELIVFERGAKNPHKCLLCGRSFSKLKYIKLHVRRAHVRDEDQPYRCKVCGSGFVRLTEFRKHTRSHSDFRPYKCNYCDKAFKQQANLTDHYRVHANTKSYQCFICKTMFRQRGGLTSHVVFHDTLKPYKCMYCSKGYTTRGELSRHMQKYNRDDDGVSKSYQCHLCDSSFPHYPMLMKHIELHSPEKPFHCQMCSATFSSYVTMYFHKVDQGHFFKEDIEQGMKDLLERGRKFRAKKMESQLLMREYDGHETVNELADEILYVNQADGSLQTEAGVKPVEIIIEEFGKDRVVHMQGSEPEHDELLSIAKQLTELSGFTETEVQTSGKKNLYQEEDEIIKHMLDADEDVLASLNKSKVYNNGVIVGNMDERNEDSYKELEAEEMQVENESQGEPNVSYGNQTLPTTMEELVSIVSQNVTTDGNDQVMAYQSEDGSMIYVCLAEGDNKMKEIVLEQGTEEQYVTDEANVVMQYETEDSDNKTVEQIVHGDYTNDNEEVNDIDVRNEAEVEESVMEQTSLTSEIQGHETSQVQLINVNGVEFVQIPEEGLHQVTASELPINELNLLQREISANRSDPERRTNERIAISDGIHSYNTSDIIIPQDETFGNEETIVQHDISAQIQDKYKHAGEIQVENYTAAEEADEQFEEMGKPAVEDAEESREALLRRSQLAQHLTGNVPFSNAASVGTTHMIFTGEGLQTITSTVSDVYANSESIQSDNVSHSLINIAAAAAKIDNNGKQDIHNVIVATDSENVSNTENVETVLEYQINEARFIKEELLDPSYSGVGGDGAKAAAEVMFVSDNIYTYSQIEKKFICLHCGQKIKSFKNLKNHIRRHAPESSRIHKCTYCEKRFVTKNEWKRHIWTHTGERNYECKHCGKKFIQAGHLSEHIRLHTGKKPFRCNVCKHAFNTHSQLKLHWSRLHSDNKIPCPQCDKVFKNNIDLKRHKGLEHSGIKKKTVQKAATSSCDHICDICGMSFMKKSGLKLHLERHNLENATPEEKERFSCDICGSSFKSKHYATEHVKSVHGEEKNEICGTCGMAFTSKLLLRRHRDSLHRAFDSKWQCETCDKSFASRSALAYHVGSKH